jgi:hypothetical protein
VDLRSNGHGLARAPWTAPCARCTGPRWTARFKRRGTRSWPSARDRTAQDACRWAAAMSPESGGARRELAGVGPGRRSRPSTRPQASAKRRGGACTRDRGVKGGDRASSAAGAERGWRGCSGELAGTLLCVKGRDWAGVNAHSSTVKRASSKTKRIQRRRGLATAAGRAALRCGRGAAPTGSEDANLQPNELDEPLVNPKRREGRRQRWSFTDGDACTAASGTRGGGAGELGLDCVE